MTQIPRRHFLSNAALSLCGLALASRLAPEGRAASRTASFIPSTTADGYLLPDLPYAFEALEPSIDARTMRIHHGKHHAGYTRNLNAALTELPDGFDPHDLTSLFAKLSRVDPSLRSTLRNNGGGYYNHCLFWDTMTPSKQSGPTGALSKAIDDELGGFAALKETLSKAATTRFGSGWAWLLVTPSGKLAISSTPNQDNPLMTDFVDTPGTPILGLDVWEHAYYLHYQNRRGDYVAAWFDVVDWDKVSTLYEAAV